VIRDLKDSKAHLTQANQPNSQKPTTKLHYWHYAVHMSGMP